MAIVSALGPHHNDHPAMKQADRGDPDLAIIDPLIDELEDQPFEDDLRIGKIEAACGKSRVAFGGIEDGRHEFMYLQKLRASR